MATTTLVEDGSAITRNGDKPGGLKVLIPFSAGAFAQALVDAWGGPTYQAPYKAYILEYSLDGGASFDSGMWLESGEVDFSTGLVTLDGEDLAAGLLRTNRDRIRYTNVEARQILYGAPGTITFDADALMAPGQSFPWLKGLLGPEAGGQPTPLCRSSLKGAHRVAFAGVIDPEIASVRITLDTNEDSLAGSLTTLAQTATGYLAQTTSTLPVGIHQHWVADLPTRQLLLGYVGRARRVRLRSDAPAPPAALDETREALIVTSDPPLLIQPHLQKAVAQAGMIGGADNHGLPDGASFTALCPIRFRHAPDAEGWDASALVAGLSTGQGGGGVYLLFDKTLYPLSQRMDVADVCYDAPTDTLYAATLNGIYYSTVADALAGKTWAHLGAQAGKTTLSAACAKVWSPASGVVYALASSPDNGVGGNGLYRHPQHATEAGSAIDNAQVYHANWSRLWPSGSVADAAGTDAAMYILDSAAPSTLTLHTGNWSGVPQAIDTPAGETIVALNLDQRHNRIFILTQAGALGMYYLDLGSAGPMAAGSTDASLSDDFGPLTPARIAAYPNAGQDASNLTINGVPVALLCATERGPYFTTDATGQVGWRPTTGQNGLTDVSGTLIAAGAAHTTLCREVCDIWTATDRALYRSRTGGIYFTEITATPLDLGPFFAAYARQNGAAPFPDGGIGALGAIRPANPGSSIGSFLQDVVSAAEQALEDTGGCGSLWRVDPSGALAPDALEVYARRLTELSEYTYRLYDSASLAPYTAFEANELSEMTADDARGAITASSQLAAEHLRRLHEGRQQQVLIHVGTQYTRTDSALRSLKFGDLVTLDYSIEVRGADGTTAHLCQFRDAPFYVLGYTATQGQDGRGGGAMLVDLVLGTILALATDPDDLGEIVSGIGQAGTKQRRFAKSRRP